jgi:hypothetical protein
MPYTAYQQYLFERVLALREKESRTFDAIAKQLTSEGFLSARGCALMAEHVFSIYKKGKLRHERLTSEPHIEVVHAEAIGV